MVAGGQIRVVLTLDDAGFSVKTKKAADVAEHLKRTFQDTSKASKAVEADVGTLSKVVEGVSGTMRQLDQTLGNFVTKLNQTAERFERMATTSRKVKQSAGELKDGLTPVQRSLAQLSQETNGFRVAMESLKPSLQQATQGHQALQREQDKTAAGAKKAAQDSVRAKIEALNAEKEKNGELIASKRKLIQELEALEAKMRSDAEARRRAAEAAEKRLGPWGGKNVIASNIADATRFESNAEQVKRAVQETLRHTQALQQRNREIAQGIPLMYQQAEAEKKAALERAALIEQSIRQSREKIAADKEAERAAKESAREAERIRREENKMWRQYEQEKVRAAREAAREQAAIVRAAEKEFAKMNREVAAAERQAARERLDEARKLEREKVAAAKETARQVKELERQRREQEREAVRAAKETAREIAKAERESARASAEAARESARAAREAAAERKRLAKETADYERQEAQQTAQLWRSMAQLYGASKVRQGFGGIINVGDQFQQTRLRAESMNLSVAEMEEFNRKAYDLARQEQYLSNIDAIQARYTAITSIGANKVDVIDQTLAPAMQTVEALRRLGFESGTATNVQRNLYGLAEMRQVINDADATVRTFDTAFRSIQASGGKLNLADFETVLRTLGPGANQISDDGILRLGALMEQMKVAPGGHGSSSGAGTGVSTVGSMIKMMQLYAAGKPMKLEALQQFAEAGVLNTDAFAGSRQVGDEMVGGLGQAERNAVREISWKMARSAGMKDTQELMADPLKYLQMLREPLLEFMKANAHVYFDRGADMDSIDAQNAAFMKFFARSGFSHRAVHQQVMGMDPRFMQRVEYNLKLAKQMEDAEGVIDKSKDNWTAATMEMKKATEDLAAAFEPLLKPLAAILSAIAAVTRKAAEFAQNNPVAAMVSLTTVGVGGIVAAVRGTVGVFGSAGNAMAVLRAAATGSTAALATASGGVTAAGAAARGASAGYVALRTTVLASSLAFPALTGAVATALGAVSGVAGAIAAPFATAGARVAGLLGVVSKFGTAVLGVVARLLSWVGWASLAGQLGWVIGEWLSDLEVDGLKIGEHMQNIFLDIEVGWKGTLMKIKEGWIDFKKLIGGNDYLAEAADRAALEADRARLREFENSMRIRPRRETAAQPEAPALPDMPQMPETGFEGSGGWSIGSGGAGGSGSRREFENAFQRTLEQMRGDLAIAQLKTGTVLSGVASYDEQAQAAFTKRWLAGDFDDGKDPSKRKFATRGYDASRGWSAEDIDWSGMDAQTKETVQGWMEVYAALQKAKDEAAAVSYAQERLVATSVDADEAARRLAEDGLFKQTDAMRALMREFERQESDKPTLADNTEYQEQKRQALLNRARADMANYAAELAAQSRNIEAAFTTDTSGALIASRDRILAEQNTFIAAEKAKMDAYRTAFNERIAGMSVESEEYRKAMAERMMAEEQFVRYLENLERRKTEALMKPIQKLAQEWKNVKDQIEQMEAQWANGFIDTLHQTITTGQGDWRSFVLGMANDISKMMLKELLADKVSGAFSGLGDWLKNAMTGNLGRATGAAAGAAAGDAAQGIVEGAAATGMQAVATASTTAATALGTFAAALQGDTAALAVNTGATAANTGVTAGNTISTAGNTVATTLNTTQTTAGTAIEQLMTLFKTTASVPAETAAAASAATLAAAFVAAAAQITAASATSSAGSLFAFANGGIMTSSGALDLKAYAKGGIANSPQLALFGEGSMNEAFVPLPDGRTIPVTVRTEGAGGASGQTVNISIVVNQGEGGGESKSSQNDDRNVWSKVADRVKGVVREEIAVQQRPGGLLYN